MGIKILRPMTPGTRHQTRLDNSDLTKGVSPEKSLLVLLHRASGRNHRGIITVRHRGGGAKRFYRIIDFKRLKDNCSAEVKSIEYDPNRSCRIALLQYEDGEKRYILAPKDLVVGRKVMSGPSAEPEVGNCLPLESIPAGLTVHNVELRPGQGGKIARAAGIQVTLMAKEERYAVLLMPSGEMRRVDKRCRATIGQVGNADHSQVSIGKAGRKRNMGIRPTVRGSVMNPVDHPLGGGEGKHAGGHHFSSPSGVYARGGPTRNPKARSDKLIISRRKKK